MNLASRDWPWRDASYQFPLYNPDVDQDLGPLFNLRIGGKHRLEGKRCSWAGKSSPIAAPCGPRSASATRRSTTMASRRPLHLGTPVRSRRTEWAQATSFQLAQFRLYGGAQLLDRSG